MRKHITNESEGPTGTIPYQREGDSTMGLPELGAIEREARQLPLALGKMLEVGIYHGRTTCILAQVGPVDAVEWFGGNVELAPAEARGSTGWDPDYQKRHLYSNLDSIPHVRERVTIYPGSSHDILPILPGPYRLALLDADKREEAVLQDVRDIWRVLSAGGTLFLDDFYAGTFDEPAGTVERAWARFESEIGEEYDVEFIGYEPPDFKSVPKMARIRKLARL